MRKAVQKENSLRGAPCAGAVEEPGGGEVPPPGHRSKLGTLARCNIIIGAGNSDVHLVGRCELLALLQVP